MKITGKSKKNISKEFIRSWVYATSVVLAYHNYPIDVETLKVEIKDLTKEINNVDQKQV